MSKIAVIKTGGKQYKVSENDIIKIEKLSLEPQSEVTFDQVLLVASEDGSDVNVGIPFVDGVKVTGTVLEEGKGDKISVVKYKNKIRYKRTKGHRQQYTKVKILKVA